MFGVSFKSDEAENSVGNEKAAGSRQKAIIGAIVAVLVIIVVGAFASGAFSGEEKKAVVNGGGGTAAANDPAIAGGGGQAAQDSQPGTQVKPDNVMQAAMAWAQVNRTKAIGGVAAVVTVIAAIIAVAVFMSMANSVDDVIEPAPGPDPEEFVTVKQGGLKAPSIFTIVTFLIGACMTGYGGFLLYQEKSATTGTTGGIPPVVTPATPPTT